jgi:hypothetical protein
MIEEIHRRIRDGVASGRFEGLLFHGSGEPWEGSPVIGGDDIFWTSKSAVIAQQYIPAAGSTALVRSPSSYEMDRHIRPDEAFWSAIAARVAGASCVDVEYNKHGRLLSWRYPQNWPTYRQCVEWMKTELGYDMAENDMVEVKCFWEGNEERFMPASWKLQGSLLVTLSDDLKWRDLRLGQESDLMDLEYHQYEAFRQASNDGIDGVIINDFAQTDGGNVGHRSYGLTKNGLESREWVIIPAKRCTYDFAQPSDVTEDILVWCDQTPKISSKNGGNLLSL